MLFIIDVLTYEGFPLEFTDMRLLRHEKLGQGMLAGLDHGINPMELGDHQFQFVVDERSWIKTTEGVCLHKDQIGRLAPFQQPKK